MKDLMKKEVTMTSLEVAECTGKTHSNVLVDVRRMLLELNLINEKGQLIYQCTYQDAQGKDRPMFTLPKKEVMCLVSGYSIKLRMAIIDRLDELENQKPALPQTYLEALKALTESVEKTEQLKIENARQAVKLLSDKPLVEFAKTVEGTDKKISIGDMAKLSGVIGRNNLFKAMRENKIMIGQGRDKNKPFQKFIDRGYFEVSETIVKRTKGDVITFTSYVTGNGQVWLMKKIKEWI